MALALSQYIRTNAAGDEVWITDYTREYAASVNVGGWGSPNLELNETAIISYVYQVVPSEDGTTSSNVPLEPLTSAIAFDDGNANSVQQSIGFGYRTDGHYVASLFAIPVSTDGVTTLAGDTIVEDDYFVMDGALYIKEDDDSNTEITDYSVLIDNDDTIKVIGHKMFFNKLSVKNQFEYYRGYRNARNGDDEELVKTFLEKMSDLEADLAGANWQFAAELYTSAENIVQELLEKHEIPAP